MYLILGMETIINSCVMSYSFVSDVNPMRNILHTDTKGPCEYKETAWPV